MDCREWWRKKIEIECLVLHEKSTDIFKIMLSEGTLRASSIKVIIKYG